MKRTLIVMVALAAGMLALSAASAQADRRGQAKTVVVGLENVNFAITPAQARCPGQPLFAIGFSLVSPLGETLGNGVNCVRSVVSDCPSSPELPVVGCRQNVRATMIFRFSNGSVTASIAQRERWMHISEIDGMLALVGQGKVAGGTGAYKAATGTAAGGGTVTLLWATGQASSPHLLFVLNVTQP